MILSSSRITSARCLTFHEQGQLHPRYSVQLIAAAQQNFLFLYAMFFVKISATTKSSESIFFFKPRACVLVFTSALLLTVCKTSRITSNDVQTAWILSALCGHKWISWRVFVCHSHSLALMASLFVSFTMIVVKNRITFKALKFYSFSFVF